MHLVNSAFRFSLFLSLHSAPLKNGSAESAPNRVNDDDEHHREKDDALVECFLGFLQDHDTAPGPQQRGEAHNVGLGLHLTPNKYPVKPEGFDGGAVPLPAGDERRPAGDE